MSSQGDLTIVQIAEGVEFVFEPRTLKQAYSANLHIGPMVQRNDQQKSVTIRCVNRTR